MTLTNCYFMYDEYMGSRMISCVSFGRGSFSRGSFGRRINWSRGHLDAWSLGRRRGRRLIWSQGHLVTRSFGRRVICSQDHLVARSFGREVFGRMSFGRRVIWWR
jgi:hypothetical protein